MKYDKVDEVLCYGLMGQGRQYVLEMEENKDIDDIEEEEFILTYDKDYEWNEKGVLLRILDEKEPITLELIKQLKSNLQNKEGLKLLRQLRDKLLAETDYLMNPDYPHKTEEKKQAWKDYRQALRDLPDISNPKLNEKGDLDMNSITLPLKPK
jgi:hypothetical protein